MTRYRSDLIQTLTARGFLHQCTDLDALDAKAASGVVTAYGGFDATADSLHVGHLMLIRMLHWIQKTGHRPIALMGGGTTKVGDPSGKEETRKLLDDTAINDNIASIRTTFDRFFTFGNGPRDALLVNNADWLDELKYIPFLRDIGRHFTINRMLTMDSVKLRLEREQPLTFLEFNYMILQGYDFAELYRRHDCTLQLGGSDQWGNIVQGVDLGRRISDAQLFGFTCPLITTASGAKMGKTAAGAVWLKAERLTPYAFYQYWRNTEDADVGRFLKFFTDLNLDEIARLEALQGAEINEAKKILAFEVTKILHGESAAADAAETARRTFEEQGIGAALPTTDISEAEFGNGLTVIQLLRRTELASSNSDATRKVANNSVSVNNTRISDGNLVITINDVVDGVIKISASRKANGVIRIVKTS